MIKKLGLGNSPYWCLGRLMAFILDQACQAYCERIVYTDRGLCKGSVFSVGGKDELFGAVEQVRAGVDCDV